MDKLPVRLTGFLLLAVFSIVFGQGVTRQEYTGLDKYLEQGRPDNGVVNGVAGEFLTYPADARGVGMGEAYSAVAQGSGALWWNPSGIAFVDRYESSISHFEFSRGMDLSYTYLTAAVPIIKGKLVVGGLFGYWDLPKIPVTTVSQPQGTGDYYDAFDYQLGGSVAYCPYKSVAIGVTVKRVLQDAYTSSLSALAVDFGGSYRLELNRHAFSFSLGAQNYGTHLKSNKQNQLIETFTGDSLPAGYDNFPENVSGREERYAYLRTFEYELPSAISLGMAYSMEITRNTGVTAAFEYRRPRYELDMDAKSFGMEVTFPVHQYIQAALRTGWIYRNKLEPYSPDQLGYFSSTSGLNSYKDYCAGAGLRTELKGTRILFDYAYRDSGSRVSSGSHQNYFSLGVGF